MKKILYIIIFMLCYTLFINIFNISSYILPSILDITIEFVDDFRSLIVHSFYTLTTTFIAFIIAFIIGFGLAILIDNYKRFDFILGIVHTMQMIPTIVYAPLLIIWFGFGIGSIIFIVVIGAIFPVIVCVNNGFNSIDEDYIHFFKINNISTFDTYKKLKIPLIINDLRAGLKLVTTYAIMGCILAEYMAGQQGLGVYLANSLISFNIASAFIIIILTLVYTLAFKGLVNISLNAILWRVYGKII